MEKEPRPQRLKLIDAVAGDHPGAVEIQVSFPDRWKLVHTFRSYKRGGTPLYVAGLPPGQERTRSDRFFGLPAEINRSLLTYQQYKLFKPQTIPLFHIAWNSYIGAGHIIGAGGPRIQLQPLGQAQVWYGSNFGVIWECYLHETTRKKTTWEDELLQFWQVVERDIGATKLFTEPREPTFEKGYTDFLRRLGYAPDAAYAGWWSK